MRRKGRGLSIQKVFQNNKKMQEKNTIIKYYFKSNVA